MKKFARYGKIILALALLAAMMCPSVVSSETEHTDHVWDPSTRTRTKPATCSEPAWYTYTCSLCGATKSPLPEGNPDPDAHDWDEWTTKEATCTEAGYKERTCKYNVHHKQHIDLPATGHDWDSGKVTTEATCTTPGEKTYTCKHDSSHTRTEPIPATGHDWDSGKVTTEATCTTPGEKIYTCQNDPSHTKKETIPATGHKWDSGKILKQPTLTEEGEKLYTCQNDPSHTRIEKLGVLVMNNNTVCAFGPRLRDVNLYPYNTDVWYMFTPFDASKEGRQTFELVASNMYIVGTLTIDIQNGAMTVDYKLADTSKFDITLEFFTVLSKLDDIHNYEPEDLMDLRMTTRRPINLQDTFGDDRNLVLYFCSRASYTYNDKFKSLDYNSQAHQKLVRQMLEIMD